MADFTLDGPATAAVIADPAVVEAAAGRGEDPGGGLCLSANSFNC